MNPNKNLLNELFTWKVIGLIIVGTFTSIGMTAIGFKCFVKDSFGYEVFTQFGYAGFTGIVITLLMKYYFDKDNAKEIALEVSEKLKKDHSTIKVSDAIVDIFEERPRDVFDKLFKNAEKQIDILTTNLDTLTQYDVDIEKKLLNNDKIKVRLLALNPKHSFIKNRIDEDKIYDQVNFFFIKLVTSIRKFTQLKDRIRKNNNNITIKMFDSPPSIMYYRFDDEIMLGFILKQASSRYYTHLILRANNEMALCFNEHFEKVFNSSKEVFTNDLDGMKEYEN